MNDLTLLVKFGLDLPNFFNADAVVLRQGYADGVVGGAEGEIDGDMFYWAYTIDLPLPSGEMRVSFKDYMWMLSETRVLNKAYMSKWGIPVGEVTIMFEKVK
jgi:hypothetical protein